MMSDDWRYTEDRMKLREQCLKVLLNRYGGIRIDQASYSTQDIYECVDTWISQGKQKKQSSTFLNTPSSLQMGRDCT